MNSIRTIQQLGQSLRAARKQLGLTQSQLALAAGVGLRFIVDLEAGKPTLLLTRLLLKPSELNFKILADSAICTDKTVK